MKEYLAVKENGKHITHIKVETHYDLGGINFATYKTKPRGYYISVLPVERSTTSYGVTMESYTAFSGYCDVLKTVTRKSKKAETEAEQIAETRKQALIDLVLEKHGLELA